MIKKIFISIVTVLSVTFTCQVSACPICYTEVGAAVRAGLFDALFLFILSIIASVFLIFFIASIGITYLVAKVINGRLFLAGMLFGGGMAGLFDGVIFHQILQTHNMIANILPITSLVNAEINMFWDGMFHAYVFVIILISMILFLRAMKYSNNDRVGLIFTGSVLVGAGMFNLIEGFINHYIFQLHHVVQKNDAMFMLSADLMFTLVSSLVVIAGSLCLKSRFK